MTDSPGRTIFQTIKHKDVWEIFLNFLFPGIGQIIHGRWRLGIPLVIFNGLTLYIFWIVLMPISMGMLLHDRRE